ncbi:MAG: hypothetical protein O2910_03580 [Proteobacteria bacterium]|nr:hypothetical protein [Pseudomonadota bacterium]
MNRIADFTRAEELKIRRDQNDPLNDSETWMREKIESWRTTNRNAGDLGRALLATIVLINSASAILFLGLGVTGDLGVAQLKEIGRAVDFSLIGVVAAIFATVAGCLMHRSTLNSATFDLIETWRNLNTKEQNQRKTAHSSATILFWITANFVILSIVLFTQSAWIAKDALI